MENNHNKLESQNLFNVIINTPQGTFLDEMVSLVTFKTTEGYRGIMKDATEFIGAIIPSKMYISFNENEKSFEYYVDHGIGHFKNNIFSIIVNEISDKEISNVKIEENIQDKNYSIIEEIKIKRNIVKNNTNNS